MSTVSVQVALNSVISEPQFSQLLINHLFCCTVTINYQLTYC